MIWLRGDDHYIKSACGHYTIARGLINGRMRYEAWRRVKESEAGQPFNPPICLGAQFENAGAAKQACHTDSIELLREVAA